MKTPVIPHLMRDLLPVGRQTLGQLRFRIKSGMTPAGFTLIELLIVFSTTAILSTVGIASFATYSRTQALTQSTFDVVTQLNFAKARARTQVNPNLDECAPTGQTNLSLEGYALHILDKDPDLNEQRAAKYQFKVICGGQLLPAGEVQSISHIEDTENPTPYFDVNAEGKWYIFKVLSGQVNVQPDNLSGDSIIIHGYNGYGCKKINIEANGRITIAETCP